MQYFATQLNSHQQTSRSFRAEEYRKTGKRQRDDEPESGSASPQPDDISLHSRPNSLASHSPLDVQQLRAAGLLAEDDFALLAAPFPHADARHATNKRATQVAEQLADPPIRLYAAYPSSKGPSIGRQDGTVSVKSKHLNNLSTILHRCLLHGDFERAGRAWGMLLRTRVSGGDNIDPRNHGRWGIGAEILLHGNNERQVRVSDETENLERSAPLQAGISLFSERGFQLAREYYERLIIQYPYRKLSPNNIDERTFYPAMFSLWVLEINEEGKCKRHQLEKAINPQDATSMLEDDTTIPTATDVTAQLEAIQLEELTRAIELAERIDQLIVSPPFDKHAALLQLRGHVSLWMGSLMLKTSEVDEDWDMESVRSSEEDPHDTQSPKYRNLVNYQKELLQAEDLFQRAETNGAPRQASTKATLSWNLKNVSRQLAKLRREDDDDD